MGDRITTFVQQHPVALRYVARSVADGDQDALQIFDAFVAIADRQWRVVREAGLVRADADLEWAALHTIVMNLATVLFAGALNRHLPEPFFTPAQLERWNRASQMLFRQGYYVVEHDLPSEPE